jgi:predicted enzyme related to lactoylglutathione lyase/uncharacterized glyoxalase superfamily protein PhnB
MIINRSAPLGTMIPKLTYDDVPKAADWLCDVFGFTERLRAGTSHAQLAYGMGGVMLGESRTGQGFAESPDDARLGPPRPNEVSTSLTVHVEEVDRHYEHAKQRGARILQPPVTHMYGERQYTAEDFAGYRWTFTQSVADVDPADWGAKVANIGSPLTMLPRPRFCYLEIPALDLKQSVAFYETVFGWSIRRRDTERPSFDDATGYISGAWVTTRNAAREPGLLPYVWVDDIDSTLAKVAANGGQALTTAHLDSPGGETVATFRDPAGNVIGLYQEGKRLQPPPQE